MHFQAFKVRSQALPSTPSESSCIIEINHWALNMPPVCCYTRGHIGSAFNPADLFGYTRPLRCYLARAVLESTKQADWDGFFRKSWGGACSQWSCARMALHCRSLNQPRAEKVINRNFTLGIIRFGFRGR
jgi:hypothetical protein